ncbi:hypothetical protein QQS21_006455 [Conoideocrella luteorostrata]|uniref:asparaginase n=1 Tax=Conoideocrella luteorostrata TaxID=1105319 RepID=A0AAJ0CMX1_9HYPO|nr:hypothetical protein QQS21_006455 [Conoideocrella luteorostrata]
MIQSRRARTDAGSLMATSESLVLIMMTGGTISMQQSPSGYLPAAGFQEACLAGNPLFNDGSQPGTIDVVVNADGDVHAYASLRTPPSAYRRKTRYVVFEFDELFDSASVGIAEWTKIAEVLSYNYELYDGFVVLHGTDTLAYTSSALSFMLQNLQKPVILTGAQTPMRELQSDAIPNLLGSLVIAGHFTIPEVCLYFNHRLLRGNRSTKISASDFAAFGSPNYPPLATTSSSRTTIAWELVREATKTGKLSLRKVLNAKHVACLRLFPNIRPEMVSAILKLDGLRGVVLETFGPGSAPLGDKGALIKALKHAADEGIVIISVSQCLIGSVNPIYDSVAMLGNAGIISGFDMTTEAALAKMAYLFASPDATAQSVAENMARSIRGEMSQTLAHSFKRPTSHKTAASIPLLDSIPPACFWHTTICNIVSNMYE